MSIGLMNALISSPGLIDPVPVPRPAPARADGRLDLVGLPRNAMRAAFEAAGMDAKAAKLRAKQVWHRIYHRGARDFAGMTEIGKPHRALLAERFAIGRPEIAEAQVSSDGTRKWLLRSPDAQDYEMVFIPDADRGTLCVSSQVGCTLNCRFCHTGTMRLVRNLSAGEIVGQVMLARDGLGEWPSQPEGRMLTNIVMMGMGEPLYNLDNVADAIDMISDGEGIAISRRRITVSTSGVVPELTALGERTQAMLAISLHATNDDLRDCLVPLNKKYDIAKLMDGIRAYPGLSNARRVTFEYVMLKGVNDSPAEALALVKLLKGIPAKINLIPFNPWPGTNYQCSDWETIERFAEIVNKAGYASPVRTPRGRDILAACGQLKSASEKVRASQRTAAPPPLDA